jgi:hypothetical protein
MAGAKMAPISSRQIKPVQSPEPHLDSSQASSRGMADSQGTEAINTMIEQKLKDVSVLSTRSLYLHPASVFHNSHHIYLLMVV